MKFVSLRTKRAHRRGKLDKPSCGTHESFARPTPHIIKSTLTGSFGNRFMTTFGVNTPNGSSQMANLPCVILYEARLMDLLDRLTRRKSARSIVDPHRLLEQGAN